MDETERLDQLADVMTQVADRVAAVIVELGAFHRLDVWSGRRADRFGDELADRHRQARSAADALANQATTIRTRASLRRIASGPVRPP